MTTMERGPATPATPIVYLDHARSSLPRRAEAIAAMRSQLEHLGLEHPEADLPALEASWGAIDRVRGTVAGLLRAPDPARVVFTGSSTEALTTAIAGLGLGPGDHVLSTAFDHNAISRPLAALHAVGVETSQVGLSAASTIEASNLAAALRPNTRLIAITHASNVSGAACELGAIGRLGREAGVPVLVDAAASVGVLPIDVEASGLSMVCFGAHKRLRGPAGIGVLWASAEVSLVPRKFGSVYGHDPTGPQPRHWPWAMESGTPNLLGILGLGAAVRAVLDEGLGVIGRDAAQRDRHLRRRLSERLGIEALGVADGVPRVPIVSVALDDPTGVARQLREREAVIANAGQHNAPVMHQALGTGTRGALRLSPSDLTPIEDLERAVEALARSLGR